MTVQAGDKAPDGRFHVINADGPGSVSTDELFSGKKVVVFSVPGAFTPNLLTRTPAGIYRKCRCDQGQRRWIPSPAWRSTTCSSWMSGESSAGAGDKVLMLADGNGTYTAALGLELDGSGFGLGTRGQRFAMVVEDGTITHLHVEAPMEFKVSSAESILENL